MKTHSDLSSALFTPPRLLRLVEETERVVPQVSLDDEDQNKNVWKLFSRSVNALPFHTYVFKMQIAANYFH
jgi:hypothetical protein